MPPKHQEQQPAPQQQQQQQQPVPTVNDWILKVLNHAALKQGGPCAMTLANPPFINLPNEQIHQTIASSIEGLPTNMPAFYWQSLQQKASTTGCKIADLQAIYGVVRFFLIATVVCSNSEPRERLETMLHAYTCFETNHKSERGSGEAGALFAAPGQAPTNVGWDTALLVVLCQKIRALAQVEGALDDGLLSDLIRKWRSLFLFLVSCDQGIANNVARRRGALVVLNCLLAVLFHLGNLHQVKALLQLVDSLEAASGGDPNKGVFGPCGHIKSEVTKLFYYQARVKLYAGLDQTSFSLFSDTCARLPPLKLITTAPPQVLKQQNTAPIGNAEVKRNKLRCLFYLFVNGILCGYVPDIDTLLHDGDRLMHSVFAPIISAINAGSPTKLDQALSSPGVGPVLRTRSVFLQMKQMYLLTIFVAVRRIHSILAEIGEDNSRIDIACIDKVSKCLDDAATGNKIQASSNSPNAGKKGGQDGGNNNNNNDDDDEASPTAAPFVASAGILNEDENTHCNLSLIVDLGQMIQLGWIKGYIAFEHQILVLSKKDPFPKRG